MSSSYTAGQLYRRRFPNGHQCASADVESHHVDGAADDMRLRLVRSLFTAITSTDSSDPRHRRVLDSRLESAVQGMRDSNHVLRHVLRGCPTTSKSAAVHYIANAIADHLSHPVRSEPGIELVGIFISEPPQDGDRRGQPFSVKFLRGRAGRWRRGGAHAVFIEVCPWSQPEFRGVRQASVGPPDRSGTARPATGPGEAWWWAPSSSSSPSNAAEPVQAGRQQRQNRETTVAAARGNDVQEALPFPVREERADWAGIIKWICAAVIAIDVVGAVVFIGMLGQALSTRTHRVSRPIRPYKVPLVKRRAIDPTLGELVSMLGKLASTTGRVARKLTEMERLRPVTSARP
ncbi:hypothetical protein B0T26DRAFT_756686 [Lasiosphaeria miniovina]|uniref:Uncharacterized protein n=1 Tax=Lasiosphaeria miniovina TaxID=1954250 RepID=A0AA39ZT33_9PEZI|nr:uncharacterized protein B0T26DRAFT_756686 [Lasiosphaeria miniovina]KAK0703122.1 hypothetical protein B0T26DRAFT_756686 [Lasiosphaeria miniovina]